MKRCPCGGVRGYFVAGVGLEKSACGGVQGYDVRKEGLEKRACGGVRDYFVGGDNLKRFACGGDQSYFVGRSLAMLVMGVLGAKALLSVTGYVVGCWVGACFVVCAFVVVW